MRRILAGFVLVGLLAACGSSKPSAVDPPTTMPAGTPKFAVVIDDDGLTFPAGKTLAGTYLVSFEDRRTAPPAGQKLHLQFLVPGPQIVAFDVLAGTSSEQKLLANMQSDVVWFDPGVVPVVGEFLNPDDFAKRHSLDVPVTNSPEIETTPEFPTPVT